MYMYDEQRSMKPCTSPPATALYFGRWQARGINEKRGGCLRSQLLAVDIFHNFTYNKVNKHEVAPPPFLEQVNTFLICEKKEMML